MLSQPCQQRRCAGNPCSTKAHVRARVVRDSGLSRGTRHPACKHRWDKKVAEQRSKEDSKKNKRWWGPAVGMDDSIQLAVEERQAAEVEQHPDYVDPTSQPGSHSRHHGSSRTMTTRTASAPRPPKATDASGTGATHGTLVSDAPGGSKEQRESETDIFAGRNRPMSRAMKWCGWTTSSFVKFLAECCCIWAKCKCGHCRNVESGNVQTEAFNRGLHPDEQSVLVEQSDLTTFGEEIPNIIHRANEGQAIRQLSVVQNPRKSWLWDFDFMKLNQ